MNEWEETELGEQVGQESIPGGKAVLVDLINRERAPRRAADDQMGASAARSDTP